MNKKDRLEILKFIIDRTAALPPEVIMSPVSHYDMLAMLWAVYDILKDEVGDEKE